MIICGLVAYVNPSYSRSWGTETFHGNPKVNQQAKTKLSEYNYKQAQAGNSMRHLRDIRRGVTDRRTDRETDRRTDRHTLL